MSDSGYEKSFWDANYPNANGCAGVMNLVVRQMKIYEERGMEEGPPACSDVTSERAGLPGAVKSEDFFLSASQYGVNHAAARK